MVKKNSEYIDRTAILSNPMFHTWKKKDLVAALQEAPVAASECPGSMELACLRERLAKVSRERDALLKQIDHNCTNCAHWVPAEAPEEGMTCGCPGDTPCDLRKRESWQWKGVD